MMEDAARPDEEAAAPIVVLAFGTRGDVQPLAVLAAGLATGLFPSLPAPVPVRFVSHAEHGPFLRGLWGHQQIDFIPSPSPPHAAASTTPANLDEALRPAGHLQACFAACGLGRAASGGQQHPNKPRLLVANLFALEAVHLAEALGNEVPLVMAHPYPAPAPAPQGFARRLRRTDPLGYRALKLAEQEEQEEKDGGGGGGCGRLGWRDVEHWLWPAFTDAWAPLCRMLGLDKDEDNGDRHHHHLIGRAAPPLLYLYNEAVLPRPQYYPPAVHVCGYLWPSDDDGAFTPPPRLAAFLAPASPAPASTEDDYIPRVKPVLVTFGTMVSLGALGPSLDAAAAVLAAAFGFGETPPGRERGRERRRVLLDAAGAASGRQAEWAAALRRAFQGGEEDALILEEGVPHSWLLARCSAVVHHGGSGTTAACLRAGVTQVIVPMMMDQFLWAERVAWLDLGPAPLALSAVFPTSSSSTTTDAGQDDDDGDQSPHRDRDREMASLLTGAAPPPPPTPGEASHQPDPSALLADALAQALHPSTRLRAAAFGRRLRAEEPSALGLERCLAVIRGHLEARQTVAEQQRDALGPVPPGCELVALELLAADAEEEEEEDDDSLTVAVLSGSEAEVAFCHQEIFPPRLPSGNGGGYQQDWGYLRHGVRVAERDVVVDVGANIGLFSLYLDQYAMEEPDQVTVVAVEPAPRTFAALAYNLRRHGVRHTALPVAVGEAAGRATLTFYPRMPGNSTLCPRRAGSARLDINPRLRAELQQGEETVEVAVTTLPAIFAEQRLARVALLKVDVEGWEEAALRGLDADGWACVRQVVAEVHDVGGRKARVDALLREAGGFARVVWERPPWAEAGAAAAAEDGAADGMDNWMVFATRGEGTT